MSRLSDFVSPIFSIKSGFTTLWLFTAHFTNRQTALLAATLLAANPSTFTLARTGQYARFTHPDSCY